MNWPPTDPLHCKAATCSISPHCSNVYIKVSRTKSDTKAYSAPWNQDIITLWSKHAHSPHASVYIVRSRSMRANLRFDVMLWVNLYCYGDQALIVNCSIWPRVAHILWEGREWLNIALLSKPPNRMPCLGLSFTAKDRCVISRLRKWVF